MPGGWLGKAGYMPPPSLLSIISSIIDGCSKRQGEAQRHTAKHRQVFEDLKADLRPQGVIKSP